MRPIIADPPPRSDLGATRRHVRPPDPIRRFPLEEKRNGNPEIPCRGFRFLAISRISILFMARRIITQLTDDLDGTDLPEGTRPTTFTLDGVSYSIDLSDANAEKLRGALAPYIDVATRVGAPAAARKRASAGPSATDRLQAIRGWAQSNGYTVGDRGRIKQEVVDAYDAAH
jgi:hypothetical protein